MCNCVRKAHTSGLLLLLYHSCRSTVAHQATCCLEYPYNDEAAAMTCPMGWMTQRPSSVNIANIYLQHLEMISVTQIFITTFVQYRYILS